MSWPHGDRPAALPQDVIELREKRNWVLRPGNRNEGPRKIAEIHEEWQKEQMANQVQTQQF